MSMLSFSLFTFFKYPIFNNLIKVEDRQVLQITIKMFHVKKTYEQGNSLL